MTLATYNDLLHTHNNKCAICGSPPKTQRLHIDHNHKTGVIRGLLCYRCNRYLVAQNTRETARKVLRYLERTEGASEDCTDLTLEPYTNSQDEEGGEG